MGTALFTGVTGLLAHQQKLDVIADNISNVNSTGYRGSRVQFQSLFSQTLQTNRGPDGNFGGTNPVQVGLGSSTATIDTNFGQSALITTGVASDLAIQGGGFFILSDGESVSYTRDGSFLVNEQGLLSEPATGQIVQGYLADENGVIDTNAGIQDLAIPIGGAAIVEPTENALMTGNLSGDAEVGDTVVRTVRIYDGLGMARDLSLTFTKTANTNEWSWDVATSDPDISAVTGGGNIVFTDNGRLTSGLTGAVNVAFDPAQPAVPTDPVDFAFDFSELTQLGGDSDVAVFSQDGYPRGVLESFGFGKDGVINGVFTNGLTRVIGQVSLASFRNESGLLRAGNNQFMETASSGLAQVGLPNSGSRGEVTGGVLESSNVDLGTEFSNLILTQRGFQANARTMTTADSLLQETVNLAR
jgi:flagellar hook protein FlgE